MKPNAVKPAPMRLDSHSFNLEKQDGPYANIFLAVGTNKDRSAYTRASTTLVRKFTQGDLEKLYEADGFARRIIDLPCEEMVRAGFMLEGIEDDSKLLAALETVDAIERLSEGLRWAALFGGSLIVMLVNDGGGLEDPLKPENAKEIEQLRVYDRWQVSRHRRYEDPADKRFGETEIYQISPVQGMPYNVHESRCLIFMGALVPERVREENDGWGGSVLQYTYDQLVRFNMSQYWSNAILERAQQAVHGIPELTNLLRTKEGQELVKARVDLVDMTRSVNNTIVIDALEEYELKSTPLSGVSDIVDRLGLALSAVTGIPEALLFGRQQGGLSSTGDAELENWYAQVGKLQRSKLLRPLDKLVQVALYATGLFQEEYLLKFNPLSVPSDKEVAETDKLKAETRQIYVNMQALDALECRQLLDDEGYPIEQVDKLPELPGAEEEAELARLAITAKAKPAANAKPANK